MSAAITLEIVTPERLILQEEAVESIVLPGTDGLFGVLRGHQPLVSALGIGPVAYRRAGEREHVAATGGFFEFAGDRGVVLADAAERGGEIDVVRAREALERARKRLADRRGEWDFARARAALERAVTRLKVAGAD